MAEGKLIVAALRLPVTMSRKDGEWVATASGGGLVTGLKAMAGTRPFVWIGWPGNFIPEQNREAVSAEIARHGGAPIYLTRADADGFYGEFSNRAVWPLFHGLVDRVRFDQDAWNTYVRVNQMYADEICRLAEPNDLIWVHDYQLCLVPQMLRQKGVTCPIGFFLHIPFPSSEVYRTLPVRDQILNGLLGADYIGFHAYEYVSHFRKACLRVLGLESDPGSFPVSTHRVHLGVLPIGIDPAEVRTMAKGEPARAERENVEQTYRGKKIIIGVDRLDYTKGIPEKLLAFEELLKTSPRWRERCVLLQVAAPSRESVDEYQQLKRRVDELVGRINGRYSTPGHTPIVYINQSIARERLVGMYQAADVALVTPIRDGMNLVALEYIAARGELGGRLILSEFAGAAYLLPGAHLVNPYNVSEVAQALVDELEGGSRDWAHMLDFVEENTSQSWAQRFLAELEHTRDDRVPRARFRIDQPTVQKRLIRAKQPLVLLDYDGTLRGYEKRPEQATPTARIHEVLALLAQHASVYIISGRPLEVLEAWFGDLPVGLVCEHGLSTRDVGGEWREISTTHTAILKRVEALFEEFKRRTPGASIERKKASVAWHYRSADPEFGLFQAGELLAELEDLLRKRPYGVLRGNRVIEVRHLNCTKGNAVEQLLRQHKGADAVLCAGDDRTDEDMLEAVRRLARDKSVTCWVGGHNLLADYWADSPASFLEQLEQLGRVWEGRKASKASPRRRLVGVAGGPRQ